ncbi:hypothetical protein ACLOJK_035688 [Asimina triloba]
MPSLALSLSCPVDWQPFFNLGVSFPLQLVDLPFDEKQKKVIISGPFNPECLIKRLYCKVGCKIIKGHEIILPKPPPPPKKPDPPKQVPAEPPKKPDPPKQVPAEPPKKPDPPKTKDPEPEPPKKPADPPPPKPKPPPPAPAPVVPEPVHAGPPGPICCRPCCEGRPSDGYCTRGRGGYYYDTCCRDCSEGRPWDGPCTRSGYNNGCRFFTEEDSSCRTM